MEKFTIDQVKALELLWQTVSSLTAQKYNAALTDEKAINRRLTNSLESSCFITRDYQARAYFKVNESKIKMLYNELTALQVAEIANRFLKHKDYLLKEVQQIIQNDDNPKQAFKNLLIKGLDKKVSYFESFCLENPEISLRHGEKISLDNYWLNSLIVYEVLTNDPSKIIDSCEVEALIIALVALKSNNDTSKLVDMATDIILNIEIQELDVSAQQTFEQAMQDILIKPISNILVNDNNDSQKVETDFLAGNSFERYNLYLAMSDGQAHYKLEADNKYDKAIAMAFGSSDKGRRPNNEDSYNVVFHPEDPELVLSVVADGVGGTECGEEASLYVVQRLSMFFAESKAEEINDTFNYAQKMHEELENISAEMDELYFYGQTTITCTIQNSQATIIMNAGDSRAYIYNGHELNQVTSDDSPVYKLYQAGSINKDDMRFTVGNNIITNAIWSAEANPEISIIDNQGIEAVLLTTDGVTDIVSDKRMEEIFEQQYVNNPEMVVKEIIKEAVAGEATQSDEAAQTRIDEAGRIALSHTSPGKDNATLVLSMRRKIKNS